jgi:Clostridium epsilon toxin ETX/Bacillus mosquitocidal toxin MTX2
MFTTRLDPSQGQPLTKGCCMSYVGTEIGENTSIQLGDYLQSPNQMCWGELSSDGEFTVYAGIYPNRSARIWDVPLPVTGGAGGSGQPFASVELAMQSDGNLVIYAPAPHQHTAIWATNTVRSDSAHRYVAWLADSSQLAVGNLALSNVSYWSSPIDQVVDFQISSIDYDLANAQIVSSVPDVAWTETVTNNTGQVQNTTYTHAAQVTNTSGWSDTLTIHVGVTTAFKAGVPIFASGQVQLSLDITNAYTWNGSVSYSTTDTITQPLSEAAHTSYAVQGIFTHTMLNVPYVMSGTFIYKNGQQALGKVHGTYTGVNAHDLSVTITEQAPSSPSLATAPKTLWSK